MVQFEPTAPLPGLIPLFGSATGLRRRPFFSWRGGGRELAFRRKGVEESLAERQYGHLSGVSRAGLKSVKQQCRGVAQPGSAPALGAGGRRFKSYRPDHFKVVRSGDMGNRTFRRHRLHFWPEGVLQGLQGFFLQINIAEIAIHKTHQPDVVVHFLEADGLAAIRVLHA